MQRCTLEVADWEFWVFYRKTTGYAKVFCCFVKEDVLVVGNLADILESTTFS